jgi:hypothetical protein
MVHCEGTVQALPRRRLNLPIFHMPIFGGWREYVVIQPSNSVQHDGWHVGWIAKDVVGVSQITLNGPVRLLLGPNAVSFFGVDARGNQIPIIKVGTGRVRIPCTHSQIPLL